METIIPQADPNGSLWLEIGKLQAGQRFSEAAISDLRGIVSGMDAKLDKIIEGQAEATASRALLRWLVGVAIAVFGIVAGWIHWGHA